jgi:hypothetical protein
MVASRVLFVKRKARHYLHLMVIDARLKGSASSSRIAMKFHRRIGIIVLLLVALAEIASTNMSKAAPPGLNCTASNAAITSPQSGATLNGVVQIEGVASLGDQFQYYKLEFSPAGKDQFTVFSGLIRQQVNNGQLGVWDSASVPDGDYSIRLRVVDTTGNYCDVVTTGLKVQNSVPIPPTEAPTEVPTEAPPEQAVVPTAVPTIQIGVPSEAATGPTPTSPAAAAGTRTPGSTSILPGGISTDTIFGSLSQVFGGFLRTFLFGVVAMAGIMLVIGVIFLVRRVF